MLIPIKRKWLLLAGAGITVLLAGLAVQAGLAWQVRQAMAGETGNQAPLHFTPLAAAPLSMDRWGGGEVTAVALTPTGLVAAGGSGIWDDQGDITGALPGLKVSAMTLWRGRLVAALATGGLFLKRDQGWEEARTGFGGLHIRTLLESEGGELLIGAQEGLFRAAWGASHLERLDSAPVRSLALGRAGLLLAGGETGLRRIEGQRAQLLPTPDPWVDFVGVHDQEVVVVTPLGLALGPLGGTLLPPAAAADATGAAILGEQTFAVAQGRLLRFQAAGKAAEEFLPAPVVRVFTAAGTLFADTAQGLYRKGREGWTLSRPHPSSLPPGSSHVTALASLNGRLVLGFFDGGLAVASAQGANLSFAPVAGSAAWGVNALLPAGGALYVASLRGSARFDGNRLEALTPAAGGAYALAVAQDGLAIGTGQGVLLADGRFLSAFHGLPGNQALAMVAQGAELYVGTPSGLGAIRGAKVAWRTLAGDGQLPHPWVTALALHQGALFVGTYGGGVTRRTAINGQDPNAGVFSPYPETSGFKVNTGCLAVAGGRLFLGTDGHGLFRLSLDGARFVPCALGPGARRITALLGAGETLYLGTDESFIRISLSNMKEGA